MAAEDSAGQEAGDLRRGDQGTSTTVTGTTPPGPEADNADATAGVNGAEATADANDANATADTNSTHTTADANSTEATIDANSANGTADTNSTDSTADANGTEATSVAEAPKRVGRVRLVVRWMVTTLACLLVLFALIAPEDINTLSPWEFVRIPVEALVGVALLLVLPPVPRKITAAVLGAILGALTILKLFDMGFYVSLARPFDPIFDWSFLGPGLSVISGVAGKAGAIAVVIGGILAGTAFVLFVTLSVMRLTKIVAGHRTRAFQTVTVLGVVWLLLAVFDIQIAPGFPIAAKDAATLAYDNVRQIGADLNDSSNFAKEMAIDAFHTTPGDQLLTALHGKNVILVFVESYGRAAVQDPVASPGVNAVLAKGTEQLRAAGFDSRSAFLTSPTTGGGSWLSHSTMQSGLWVSNAKRYSTFTSSNRFTLSDAFKDAGWRTVYDSPENHTDWPDGRVYHFDQIYDARNLGYRGPNFSYSDVPDQYTMSTFQRFELAKPSHQPVFAQIVLNSSHTPWTPIPRMVPWNAIGNGSVYDAMPAQDEQVNQVWPDSTKIHQAFGESIQYSVGSLISYMLAYGDNNTVMIFVGDEQPSPAIVGDHASYDVVTSIVAKDPAVMDRISSWGWQEGLKPSPDAPVWPMSDFRDRFLTAFGSVSH